MIELHDVSYKYKSSRVQALTDITANIGPGMHLLLGENGAGKTTLLQLIGGLRLPTTGECLIGGTDTRLRLPQQLSRVIYLGQETTSPINNLPALVRRHACFYPEFDRCKFESALQEFGIDKKIALSDMSMGLRHKAMLAYTISLNTDILLLDEPMNGLDIESKEKLQRMLIEHIENNRTIIISTHNVAEMRHLYDGLIVMQKSHVMLNAPADDILESLAFVTSFEQIDTALFSTWIGGALHSILTVDDACARGMDGGQMDYQLLYNAIHSPRCQNIIDAIRQSVPFNNSKKSYQS